MQRLRGVVDCPNVRTQHTTEDWLSRSRRWHAQHEPHVEAWLEHEGGAPCGPSDPRRTAVWSLLRIPEARGEGRAPGDPVREPYVWDDLDAYEILFCHVVHGGYVDADPKELLRLIGSFAHHLGEAGVIPSREHEALQAEWAQWSQRLLEVWEHGGWYLPDATRLRPEGSGRRPKTRAARKRRGRAPRRRG